MKTYFNIIVILFCNIFCCHVNAQIVTVQQLFSKVDNSPQYQLWDGNQTMLMGYTNLLGASINLPSPVLTFNEGDSVELKFRNFSQGAPHTIHLHGLDVDQQNDGVPHLSFSVPHDSTRSYYFIAPHAGTYLYHCHVVSSIHVQAGMYGLLIVKPSDGSNTTWSGGYSFNKEYAWLTSEIDTVWHNDSMIHHPYDSTISEHTIPDYFPQYFLINGKSEQQLVDTTVAINTLANTNTYLRLANIGYYGNRVILPSGLNAQIISSDGRPLPVEEVSDSIVILPGERYGVLLSPTIELNDSIKVEYFDLNTQTVHNAQNVPVTISGYLGIEHTSFSTPPITVYPNPSHDIITINIGNNRMLGDIKIFDGTGRTVYDKYHESQEAIVNVHDLEAGVYFLHTASKGQSFSKKIIIKKWTSYKKLDNLVKRHI